MNAKPARSSSFYVLGGTLTRDAPSYVMRDADLDLHAALARGEFCYVLTSRQMGKSSLMVRTVVRLRGEKAKAIVIDLTALGQNLTPEQWYLGLLGRVASHLELEDELEAYWYAHSSLGPLQRWLGAIREVVLPRTHEPVFIFIDEIDATRSLPFAADEFFAGIRELYNERSELAALSRLTFCLLGVATPADLIQDARTTPFNIGHRIELTDFTEQEARVLLPGLTRAGRHAPALLKRILYWTGGHPYLTQRLCQAVMEDPRVRTPGGVDRICEEIFLSNKARDRDDNLLFVRDRMLRGGANPVELLSTYSSIWTGRMVKDDPSHPLLNELRLAGVVRSENGFLRVRNRIYVRVFNQKFIEANQPQDEVARQRAAERRGRLKVLAWAVPLVLAFAALASLAWWQSRRAQKETENFTTTANTGMTAMSNIADRMYDISSKRPELHSTYTEIVQATNSFLDTMLGIERNNPAANNLKANSLDVAIDDALRNGDHASARSKARECLSRADALKDNPDVRVRAIAARLYASAAEAFGRLGDSKDAESSAAKAEAAARQVSSQVKPDDEFTLQSLSRTYNMLGSAEGAMDHWERAVQSYQRNVGMDQKVADLYAKQGEGERNFKVVHDALEERNRIAQIDFENRQYDAARTILEEHSLAIAKTLVKWNEDPARKRTDAQKQQAHADLLDVENQLGDLLAVRPSTWPDALSYYTQALDEGQTLARSDAGLPNPQKREEIALAVARMRKLLGQISPALEAYNKYIAMVRERDTAHASPESTIKLGFAFQELASFEAHHGTKSAAPADFQSALEWLSKISSADSSVERELAGVYIKLADVESDFNQTAPAREDYGKAARASEKCIALDHKQAATQSSEAAAMLMADYQNLAFSKLGLGDRKAAADAIEKLLDNAKTEAASAQVSLDTKKSREAIDRAAIAYGTLGWAELLSNHPEESIRASRFALALDDKQAWIHANLAHAYLLAGQVDQASAVYLAHVGEQMYEDRFEISVLDDFAELRKLGFDRPAFAQMEKLLAR
jgi:AAA domain-containing protein